MLEPTINSHLPICKPMLDEYHQCAAILYRKIWIGDKPDCGPCKPGLECTQKGWVTEFFFRECVCVFVCVCGGGVACSVWATYSGMGVCEENHVNMIVISCVL